MTFLVSVSIKLKIQTCPRRYLRENEIKKRKPSSKPKTVQKAKFLVSSFSSFWFFRSFFLLIHYIYIYIERERERERERENYCKTTVLKLQTSVTLPFYQEFDIFFLRNFLKKKNIEIFFNIFIGSQMQSLFQQFTKKN